MDNKTLFSWLATIAAVIVGFLGKYWNDLRIAERKDRLERTNCQLRDLYGPLFALQSAGEATWREFRKRYRPNKRSYFSSDPPPTDEELVAWRLWMTEVFMPINLKMESVILANSHLILGAKFPVCFHRLLAHIAAYKPVLTKWSKDDFSDHASVINFPAAELRDYLGKALDLLQKQQQELLRSRGPDAERSKALN